MPVSAPPIVTRARAVALDVLRDDALLLEHATRTAAQAAALVRMAPRSQALDVIAAAWLHDIDYAPTLRRTGFHPLDGALFLIGQDWPERVVRLVAHHSLAAMEAPFYGVGHHLGVIEAVPGIDADILISADLRAGTGNPAPTVDMRLEEMSRLDEELGLVPPDVRQARYAGLRSAHERILGLT